MVTATATFQGNTFASSQKMVTGNSQPEELVRLRVSQGGNFVTSEKAVWKYVGGETFMHTVPASWRYSELMFSLAEKVDGAVSVKYQLPGEELDPDSLISVSDDSDLQELFDEYARALRLPGTPVKTFRLRIFLFRAAEDPLTPEDIAAADKYLSSRASSVDKPVKESNFSKALSKAATNSYASNYSSGSSSANITSRTGGVTVSVDTDTELAWEAGFRAGQEAMAMVAAGAAEEEWQQMMSRRMTNLARMQTSYMLGDADDGMWAQDDEFAWGMEQERNANVGTFDDQGGQLANVGKTSSGQGQQPSTVLPDGLLGDFPVDMEASQAAVSPDKVFIGTHASTGHLDARLTPPCSPTQLPSRSRPSSGQPSPGQQPGLSSPGRRSPAQLPHITSPKRTLHTVQKPGFSLPTVQHQGLLHHSRLEQLPEELEEQASVHMADVPSAEFENMFESKYSPLTVEGNSSGAAHAGGAFLMRADGQAPANKGREFFKAALPSHISAFGDGSLLRQSASDVSPAADCLPTHISEFGEDDGEGPLESDPNAMSVMKAALPEEDVLSPPAPERVTNIQQVMARFPPGSLQLPTTFELLAGDAVKGLRTTQQDVQVTDEALPRQPSSMNRSPSVEELLRKVQCVDAQQVRVLAKIGEGAFGEVSLAECPTYGRVAVKWIKPTKVERHWASFWHEAELMSRLNHPNVLRFYGLVVKGPLVVGIMMEFAKNGSLSSYLRSGIGFIPLRLRAELALHAVYGMAYLHNQNVVHFDVKPDNLLMDGDLYSATCPVLKVADFGLSKHKYNTFCSNVHDLRGTLPYMAPEMIMDHQHVTEKADVWSLGVVFWEMLTLEVPFQDMPPAQLIGALGMGKLRLPIPDWCEPEWRALMESCWVLDPLLRPSCRQLVVQLERIRDLATL